MAIFLCYEGCRAFDSRKNAHRRSVLAVSRRPRQENHYLPRNKKHLWHACGVGKEGMAPIDTLLISNNHFS